VYEITGCEHPPTPSPAKARKALRIGYPKRRFLRGKGGTHMGCAYGIPWRGGGRRGSPRRSGKGRWSGRSPRLPRATCPVGTTAAQPASAAPAAAWVGRRLAFLGISGWIFRFVCRSGLRSQVRTPLSLLARQLLCELN
jgi:hypothetical protein